MKLQSDENGLYFLIDSQKIYAFSEHFTVSEMFATSHKEFAEINYSDVPVNYLLNLFRLCSALELIRSFLGDTPITVSSGYRCAGLNHVVGGVYNSFHTFGQAADILIPDTKHVRSFLKTLQDIKVLNEVIYYPGFVHVSVPYYNSPNNLRKYGSASKR